MVTKTARRGYLQLLVGDETNLNTGLQIPIAGTPVRITWPWNDVFTGIDNPSWKSQIVRQVGATTPATGTKVHITKAKACRWYGEWQGKHGGGSFKKGRSSLYGLTGGNFSSFSSAPALPPQSVIDVGRSRFISSVRNARHKFEGGVFLAEMGETLRMIKNPAKSLFELVGPNRVRLVKARMTAVSRKLNRSGFVETTKSRRMGQAALRIKRTQRDVRAAVVDTYLEGVFGWLPLFGDISDALEAFEDYKLRNIGLTIPVYGKVESIVPGNRTTSAQQHGPFLYNNRTEVRTTFYHRIKGRVTARTPGEKFNIAESLSLDWTSWAPTLYEATPWSFLFDYLSNLGDLIEAYSTWTGDLMWTNETKRTEYKTIMVMALDVNATMSYMRSVLTAPNASQFVYNNGDAQFESNSVRFSRDKWDGSLPSFHLKVPGPTSLKWLNIGALADAAQRESSVLRSVRR